MEDTEAMKGMTAEERKLKELMGFIKRETTPEAEGLTFLELDMNDDVTLSRINMQDDDQNQEEEVYPLSLKFTRWTIAKVLVYRFCFLALFLYMLVPMDLYIRQTKERVSYIASVDIDTHVDMWFNDSQVITIDT